MDPELCSLYTIRSTHPFQPYLNSLDSGILQIVLVNAYGQPSYRQAGKNPYERNEHPSGEACREESVQEDFREASGNREREMRDRQTDRKDIAAQPEYTYYSSTLALVFSHTHVLWITREVPSAQSIAMM